MACVWQREHGVARGGQLGREGTCEGGCGIVADGLGTVACHLVERGTFMGQELESLLGGACSEELAGPLSLLDASFV